MELYIPQLLEKDVVFQKIIDKYGNPFLSTRPEGFESLCKLIIEQQVSLASAKACYLKMEQFLGQVTPENILDVSSEELRKNFVSKQKAVYLKELSLAIVSGKLNLESLKIKEENQIRNELTTIKGIGNWTADVYLMFCLQKVDVFPIGDIALQNTLKELYSVSTKEEMIILSENWKPYRSLATHFFWHYYLSKRNRKPLTY